MVVPSRTSSAGLGDQRDAVRHRPCAEAHQRDARREGQQREAVKKRRLVRVVRHAEEVAAARAANRGAWAT